MEGRALIASRVARMFEDGDFVNLGIGIPLSVANYLPEGVALWLHAENGIVGCGPTPELGKEDLDVYNAGSLPTSIIKGGYACDTAQAFDFVRAGHVKATVLGSLEVDQDGSLANWIIPGKFVPGMGGAMDLCAGCPMVIVAMEHCDKKGNPKIIKKCTLPLTAYKKVTDIVTDLCYIKVTPDGLVLQETAPGVTVDDVIAKTAADLIIPDAVGCME